MSHSKLLFLLLAGSLLGSAQAQEGQLGGFKAGIELREQATQKELGLPLYPGAQPQRDDAKDKGAVTLGLWGGAFGLHLAVGKYASADRFDEVARYYRVAMAAYGPVLECRPENSGAKAPKPAAKGGEEALSCQDAEPGAGGLVLKVGKPKDQRVVALQTKGAQVHFQLVRIEARGT
ncbi:hypothetical protein [Inhella proteolytica]|uniref:Uncharacterized protein n=1 Tax=Inhella proteolytica TaxID=2795029 RepID=A0A931NK33_9BURK|nr:hypothetical protein [Inhella proteolytica]MBH9579589.1 hypothetical protein [Inhella proteolytica]